ncbi:hypothetical protein HYC85_029418 [Camellia sinensis]|uniref:Uncharacterized protein n=1 Tax=Camellia sinensis TaxID=4442 RepID=A0A7J7FYL4_CAMSI|nr:hypothetical protein HYC85_029418 [Camellia sinensis]
MVNGQPSKEACVAIFKAALELGARKVRSRGSDVAKEACKARSEVSLELGAKMPDVLEEPKIGRPANQ